MLAAAASDGFRSVLPRIGAFMCRATRRNAVCATADIAQLIESRGLHVVHRARIAAIPCEVFTETGLEITVCHLPPGTSKWNRIEHRLFSHISMNWRGRPLVSYEAVVQLIGATTTRTGLKVHAERDLGLYPTKIKVSDDEMAAVPLARHSFHPEWNYTIRRE